MIRMMYPSGRMMNFWEEVKVATKGIEFTNMSAANAKVIKDKEIQFGSMLQAG